MKRLLLLYPAAWRRRYEAEFLAMLEEAPATSRVALDIVQGAVDARLRPQLPAEGGRRTAVGRTWLGTAALALVAQIALFWVWSFVALAAGWGVGRLALGDLMIVETRMEQGVSASSEANLIVVAVLTCLVATARTVVGSRLGRKATR